MANPSDIAGMVERFTNVAKRLRGSISDGWTGDAVAADGDNAVEAADALEEAATALLASDALIRRAGEVLKPLAKFWRDLEASDPKSWEHVIDAFAARYRADAGLRDAFDRVTAIAADLDKKRKE